MGRNIPDTHHLTSIYGKVNCKARKNAYLGTYLAHNGTTSSLSFNKFNMIFHYQYTTRAAGVVERSSKLSLRE